MFFNVFLFSLKGYSEILMKKLLDPLVDPIKKDIGNVILWNDIYETLWLLLYILFFCKNYDLV